MKRIITTYVLSLVSILCLQAQSEDYRAIETTLSYYLDGGTNNDFSTLSKAFHPSATMKSLSKGEFFEVNALERFEQVMKPGPKSDRKTSIEYINISGIAASARIRIDYDEVYLIDYMNLLKIDDQWQIVGKIYSRHQK